MLVLVGARCHHHRAFAHSGQFQELILDLADFNPEAADLDLRVTPPQKLELPVRQTAAIIPAPVHALTRAKRILQERACTGAGIMAEMEEHTSELQSQSNLVCRLLLEKKKKSNIT